MGMIQKYVGVDGAVPQLDKMGGKSWNRVKKRVKGSVEKIAGELLKLYAARRLEAGHEFKIDEGEMQAFEQGFTYEETPDQLKTIEGRAFGHGLAFPHGPAGVRGRGLRQDRGGPSGRVHGGLRGKAGGGAGAHHGAGGAAFWHLFPPVFLLAGEHRLPQPFSAPKRSKPRSSPQIKSGQMDIVVGTHRLLSKDVRFKTLGLLVLDEEQRFGVRQKERIKTLKKSVDVLALTATPIPRTLHLSMMGIRDISVINTAPEDRRSIITYICEFDAAVILEAVRRELSRGGQIFFVHNQVHNIHAMARKIQKIAPELRLDVAHGQMTETALEKVMLRFMKKRIDLLVCTSIIESGLDIPSANTIIVNRADRFGLAQMYQLRGRVGRSDEQAYAYLIIPDESVLTKDAQKRLKVLMEHRNLGAGFQIAMSDLKIRGGGGHFRLQPVGPHRGGGL